MLSDAVMRVIDKQGVLSFGVKVTEELQGEGRMRESALPRMLGRQEKTVIVQKQRDSPRVGMVSG